MLPHSLTESDILKKIEALLHEITQATSMSELEKLITEKQAEAGSIFHMLHFSDDTLKKLEDEAYTMYNNQKFEQAKELFQLLCVLSPPKCEYWVILGGCLLQLEQHEKALESFGCASLIDPLDPRPYFFAGFANYKLENFSESQACFQEVIHLTKASSAKKNDLYNEMRKQATQTLATLVKKN